MIARTLATPEIRDELVKHGANPMSMSQSEFARFVLTESESAAYHQSCRNQGSAIQVQRPLVIFVYFCYHPN
jgi:hypothetical protein